VMSNENMAVAKIIIEPVSRYFNASLLGENETSELEPKLENQVA